MKDADNAIKALLSVGLKDVEPKPGEFEKIRSIMRETNRDMAERGMFSVKLLEELQMHLREYHDQGLAGRSALDNRATDSDNSGTGTP
jgi:hypothetical protein